MGTSSTKAKNKYNGQNYDRIYLSVSKGQKDVWKAYAEAMGMSLNQMISLSVETYIEKHGGVSSFVASNTED